tara:strand:+ start:94 stop:522 length:429 start_codon:yes stop_codon:yes gene_type:complete
MHSSQPVKITLPHYFYDFYDCAKDEKEAVIPCIIRALQNLAYLNYLSGDKHFLSVFNASNRSERLILKPSARLYTKKLDGSLLIPPPHLLELYTSLGFNLDDVSRTVIHAMMIQNKVNQYSKTSKTLICKGIDNEKQKIYLL